ncbi:Zinc finger PHD-type [Arabidopsis thaliana x Arabidopsis arenosa]|uniref:Zinc finger PHD-type n=1 Tax=Arabidopsis thaliana x Arabidopsis arenosa TaxID=1240361 RepID=A0A8T1YS50_9BRAS|nr:Zinc finger PHD-type [Arabidopsis thaliana x Arabidopsis arenosa]
MDMDAADWEPESESELISLITQLMSLTDTNSWLSDRVSKVIVPILQIISLVLSMDLNSQLKPKSELMSLTTQTVSLFNSMDLDSQPEPLRQLISLVSYIFSLVDSIDWDSKEKLESDFVSLIGQTLSLEPEPELISLIHQVFSLVVSMNPEWKKLISLCPQVRVNLEDGKFHVVKTFSGSSNKKWGCLPLYWDKFSLVVEDATHFHCPTCDGDNHEEHDKAPVEIKHPLHPKHSLQLVLLNKYCGTRECYCCDEDLIRLFYYCSACDIAINFFCAKKPPVLYIDHPKWHEHTLALFPRYALLTCNLCALADASSPIYMCPPCDFVVHLRCISLPRVIRISRHFHRLSFTPCFDQGDLVCGVCRRKIDNDYGGYSCIKDGCLYAAHSRCATQKNVWDGKELEGEPEEIEEEVEPPFVRISEGIIHHFSHQHHYLRLDENTNRDYDENRQCQACTMPIYFGNFYSCMQCDFILHEECANFSRKIHHPIHPHMLAQVGRYDGVTRNTYECSACLLMCTVGFFYGCSKEGCDFQLHVQCATISEPLVHESHKHPLFLTSKPGVKRSCSVCKRRPVCETFNCIDKCDFALCFECATLPHTVRYKHDKHMLTLSYDKETSSMMPWCEVCEGKIYRNKRFYKCDEYCCVTLHIDCLHGRDLYMKPGLWWINCDCEVLVLPNNMSRPICFYCKKRCPQKVVLELDNAIFCSSFCIRDMASEEY